MGERGDFAREHVLDPAMQERVLARPHHVALDVGCGEGRFCRWLRSRDLRVTGIDPTERLVAEARLRDPSGDYRIAKAESLPFAQCSFDLVVSYLSLIDIADFRTALKEMMRVLRPGGTLLIANINSFISSRPHGWVTDQDGRHLYYPIDRYSEEFSEWVAWGEIRIENWHRPLSAYMRTLLDLNLALTYFDEPLPRSGGAERQQVFRRAPWFLIMEWRKGD